VIGSLRLMVRGISPTVTEVLAIETVDVSTPQTQVLIFLNMMPYFIIMVIFIGGMHVIVDATAGERERNSLEPLLINPVKRSEFVIGKLLAPFLSPYGCICNLAGFCIAQPFPSRILATLCRLMSMPHWYFLHFYSDIFTSTFR
jgi:sodium transport system permease protein